jgi:hypothetical protein
MLAGNPYNVSLKVSDLYPDIVSYIGKTIWVFRYSNGRFVQLGRDDTVTPGEGLLLYTSASRDITIHAPSTPPQVTFDQGEVIPTSPQSVPIENVPFDLPNTSQ